MKKTWLIHALWVVLAAGAFAVGRLSVSGAKSSAASGRVAAVVTPPPASSATKTQGSGPAAKNASSTEDPAKWAQKFRSADGTIAADKMALAVREALRESDPVKSMMNFAQLVKEISPDNAAAAFKTVRETVAGFETMRYLPMLTYAWGSIDGEKALTAMKELGGREAMFSSGATLAGYASANPDAAKKWLSENGTPENKWMLQPALITGLARTDFDSASQYVMALDEKERANYVGVLAEQQIKNGITDAAQWALGLSDPKMKTSALERIADQYTRQDPTKAAEWIKEFAGQDYAKDAVTTVARQYAEKDPKSALEWAGSLPAGDAQTDAYGRVFREWGRSDASAAAETLNSMASGAPKDEAVSSFTRTIARENPEDAITWSAAIGNPQQREQAQVEIVQRWRASDAAAATDWAAANLSPEAQQKASEAPRWDGRGGGQPGRGGPPGGPPGFFGR